MLLRLIILNRCRMNRCRIQGFPASLMMIGAFLSIHLINYAWRMDRLWRGFSNTLNKVDETTRANRMEFPISLCSEFNILLWRHKMFQEFQRPKSFDQFFLFKFCSSLLGVVWIFIRISKSQPGYRLDMLRLSLCIFLIILNMLSTLWYSFNPFFLSFNEFHSPTSIQYNSPNQNFFTL